MTFRKTLFIICLFISSAAFSQRDSILVFSYPRIESCGNKNFCFSDNDDEVGIFNVTDIPEQVMKQKKLKRITFFESPLLDLPSLVKKLKSFPNLVSLGFIECEFHQFPTALCELKNLRALTIVYDKIPSVPESISQLSNLEFLDLGDPLYGGNALSELPASMSQLKKLSVLYLFGNNFSEFPESCTKLPLTFLNLRNNRIHDFAPIAQLDSLRKIDIASNPLFALPHLENLQALRSLDVSDCQLRNEEIPFDKLSKLEHLFIGGNWEMNVDENFMHLMKLRQLRELNLENCHLKYLPTCLASFPALETIGLQRCDSMNFNQVFSLLANIATLREISLRQCGIKKLSENIVLLQQIRVLDLYFNNLETYGPLCELKNLEKLYLVANPLDYFDNCLSNLNHLNELYLPSSLSQNERSKAKKIFSKAHLEFF